MIHIGYMVFYTYRKKRFDKLRTCLFLSTANTAEDRTNDFFHFLFHQQGRTGPTIGDCLYALLSNRLSIAIASRIASSLVRRWLCRQAFTVLFTSSRDFLLLSCDSYKGFRINRLLCIPLHSNAEQEWFERTRPSRTVLWREIQVNNKQQQPSAYHPQTYSSLATLK